MGDFILQRASSYAGDIDNLILLITVLVGVWFFLVEGMFFYLLWKFRAKDGQKGQYITGKEKHLKRWINIPHGIVLACDVVIIVFAINVWYNVKQSLPDAESTIRVIGQQWAWIFQQPGADNTLDTDDDIFTTDDLYVSNETTYHFHLVSRDVIHDFSVPVFRLKQDAIPGRSITGWFRPTQTGTFDVQCAEMCGIGHGVMSGRIHVQTAAEHSAWVAANSPAAGE